MGLAGKWAGPGGTAMPGQPVTEPEQAPELYPLLKISLILKRTHGPRINVVSCRVNATEPRQFVLEISGFLGPFLSPSHELFYCCKQL